MLPLVVFIFISPVVALFIAAAITSGFSCPTGWAFILYVVLMTLQGMALSQPSVRYDKGFKWSQLGYLFMAAAYGFISGAILVTGLVRC